MIIFSAKCNNVFEGYSFTTNCFLRSKSMKLYLSGNTCSLTAWIHFWFLFAKIVNAKKWTNNRQKLWLFGHLHITFYFILTNFYNHILFLYICIHEQHKGFFEKRKNNKIKWNKNNFPSLEFILFQSDNFKNSKKFFPPIFTIFYKYVILIYYAHKYFVYKDEEALSSQ